MKKTDAAYLAGIIDSDGSVSLGKVKTSSSIPTSVLVGQRNPKILRWCKKVTGRGTITLYKKTESHIGRPMYRWRATKKNDVLYILTKVLPYLKLKRHRAEIVYEATNLKGNGRGHGFPVSPENLIQRKELYRQFRKLMRASKRKNYHVF